MLIALVLMSAQTASPAVPEPADIARAARLSALLAAHDYMVLTRLILSPDTAQDTMTDLDWLRARMMGGSSSLVTMLYARRLWQVAEPLPANKRDGVRQSAVMALLYAYGATRIDGERCGDATAPSHVRDALPAWLPGVGGYVRQLTPATRATLVDLAVRLDARTAAKRDATGDVDFLCRNGLEETEYDLRHGGQRKVPTAPGHIGQTIILTGDGHYRPSLRPEANWKPLAAADRSRLRQTLTALVDPQPIVRNPPLLPPVNKSPPPVIIVPNPQAPTPPRSP